MTLSHSHEPPIPSPNSSNEVPVIDGGVVGLIRVLIDSRALLWRYPLTIGVLVVALSFLFPNVYRSTVTILPPERDFQSMSQPTGDVKSFLAGGMALPVMATPADILAAVLESRSVCESTTTELDLSNRWKLSRKDVLDELRGVVHAKVAPSGIISFTLEHEDRWFSDTLANTMVRIADRLNQSIVNTKASRTRQFVEERLAETQRQLDTASARLERFQQQHRTIALEVEVKAMVEGAATLRAQQTADEIELSVLRESLSPDHPRIRALTVRIAQTEQKLLTMDTPVDDSARVYLGTGFAELPRLTQELAGRLRDVKVSEALYELLTQQFEHARIQERRDTPTFSVLDAASGGGEKVRPKRLYLGIGTFVVGIILAAGGVVIRDWLARLSRLAPERHQSILALWQAMFRPRASRSREASH